MFVFLGERTEFISTSDKRLRVSVCESTVVEGQGLLILQSCGWLWIGPTTEAGLILVNSCTRHNSYNEVQHQLPTPAHLVWTLRTWLLCPGITVDPNNNISLPIIQRLHRIYASPSVYTDICLPCIVCM